MAALGVIAAGHPLTARTGGDALRAGGNAVDAAVGSMLASFACEPMLTGLGAGGYMLIAGPEVKPVLLDFFVEAPGRGADRGAVGELLPVSVSFGDAVQIFNVGAASVGTYGMPAGLAQASERFGSIPLKDLVGPAAQLAREGVALNAQQAYVIEILGGIAVSTPESSALLAPEGKLLGIGELVRQPELADALELLGAEGSAPFYTGEIATAISAWVLEGGGQLTREDLAAYRVRARQPVLASYRGRAVLTNPPPSAGGVLLAHALATLESGPAPPSLAQLVEAMEDAQAMRTTEFLEGLDDPEFVERFLAGGGRPGAGGGSDASGAGGRLGSTTHIAVLDASGLACSVTCSNGSCSGVVVPGTGVHLNNMLGEQDLNPLGFHRHPPGRRLPSMMAPTIVLHEGRPELVLGSAGSNRIRSAILQTIIRVIDDELPVGQAVRAPRVHYEDGIVYAEPGVDLGPLEEAGRAVARFRDLNLFFGGVQAVARRGGALEGGGDPRRGGAAIVVE